MAKPEILRSSIEGQTEKKLQEVVKGIMEASGRAEGLVAIKRAWERGDNKALLEAFREWGWRSDALLEILLLGMATEDEARALGVYRQWVRENMERSRFHRESMVTTALNWFEVNEMVREEWVAQGKYSDMDRLMEKMREIVIEEATAIRRRGK